MSYDIDYDVPPCVTCGRSADPGELGNPTYNLTGIFDLALTGEALPNPETADRPRGLRVLTGRTGVETLAQINGALDRLRDDRWRDRFHALEPDNGWGTIRGAIETLERLRDAAAQCPTGVWRIR